MTLFDNNLKQSKESLLMEGDRVVTLGVEGTESFWYTASVFCLHWRSEYMGKSTYENLPKCACLFVYFMYVDFYSRLYFIL